MKKKLLIQDKKTTFTGKKTTFTGKKLILANKTFPMPKIKGFLTKFTSFADFYINFTKILTKFIL